MVNWFDAAKPRQIGGKNPVKILTYETWPKTFKVDPCDLSQIVEVGRDWALFRPQETSTPFSAGPLYQATERIVRFDGNIKKSEFETLLVIFGLDDDPRYKNTAASKKDYAVIYSEASSTFKEHFLSQIRTIDPLALHFYFEAIDENELEHALLPQQTIPMSELLWGFIEQEQLKWGTLRSKGSKSLEGTFGGGERLRFGLMKEADDGSVVRLWSDSWESRV